MVVTGLIDEIDLRTHLDNKESVRSAFNVSDILRIVGACQGGPKNVGKYR